MVRLLLQENKLSYIKDSGIYSFIDGPQEAITAEKDNSTLRKFIQYVK